MGDRSRECKKKVAQKLLKKQKIKQNKESRKKNKKTRGS